MPGRRSGRRNRSTPNRRSSGRRPTDFWRAVPDVDRPEPITPAADTTALLRSLGPPPLAGQTDADRYLAAVVDKAAGFATALAAQAELLPPADDE